jgi:Acyl-CoA dehydrogenase, N-terminal domain
VIVTPKYSSLDALPRTSDRLSDDLLLPEETVKIRSEVRDFATTVLAPRAAELNSAEESKGAFPRDVFDAMVAAGLYTIPFASDVGGRGLKYPMLAAATVLEELAYYTPGVASALYDGQALRLVINSLELIEPVYVEQHFRRCGSRLTDGDALQAVHPRISRMRCAETWGGAHSGAGGCLALEELFITVRAQIHHAGVGDLEKCAIMALQRAPNVDEEDAVGPQRAEVSPSWLHAAL